MNQFVQMLSGAAAQAITHPLSGGIASWLTTTLLLFVVFPSLLGTIIGQNWWTPLGKFWWKYLVYGPFWVAGRVVASVTRELWSIFFPVKKKSKNRRHRNDHDEDDH